MAGSSMRNLFKGYNELSGLYENKDSTYSDDSKEEEKIMQINFEIKRLIEGLDKMSLTKDETET